MANVDLVRSLRTIHNGQLYRIEAQFAYRAEYSSFSSPFYEFAAAYLSRCGNIISCAKNFDVPCHFFFRNVRTRLINIDI